MNYAQVHPKYMAVEVGLGKYLFHPSMSDQEASQSTKQSHSKPRSQGELLAWVKANIHAARHGTRLDVTPEPSVELANTTPEPVPNFRQNPLHDLESLWWIGYSMLLNVKIGVLSHETGKLMPTTADFPPNALIFLSVTSRLPIFEQLPQLR